jgi:fatty acid desaturase
MSSFPYVPRDVRWKRPPIDRDVLKECSRRSDLNGLFHCLGVIAVLGASGALSYWLFLTGRWVLMGIALYVHGGLFAFNPQTHELAHGTVFRTKWLNEVFRRIFGIIHWNANSALYWMSHKNHHRYTLHKQSEGEVVLPMPETTERVLHQAIRVVDVTRFLTTVYDQLYSIFRPYLRNPRRSVWERYVYSQATERERRNAYWTRLSQFLFHALFAAVAIVTGHWFLIVIVTLPMFYGGSWYHTLVHDTMHVGRKSEVDDFRECCRSVRLDPFTSFMFWHMEWHTEHHAYPAVPCYNLAKFHRMTAEHWEPPQSLREAWREMNRDSEKHLVIA